MFQSIRTRLMKTIRSSSKTKEDTCLDCGEVVEWDEEGGGWVHSKSPRPTCWMAFGSKSIR